MDSKKSISKSNLWVLHVNVMISCVKVTFKCNFNELVSKLFCAVAFHHPCR